MRRWRLSAQDSTRSTTPTRRSTASLNSRANAAALKQDSSYPLLCALEILDGEGNFERKADMFSKRTIRPNAPVTHADDPQAALAASLSERGRVDLPYMARLTGMGKTNWPKR